MKYRVFILWSWRSPELLCGWYDGARYRERKYRATTLDTVFLSVVQKKLGESRGASRAPWVLGVRLSAIEGLIAKRIVATSISLSGWLYNYPTLAITDEQPFQDRSSRAQYSTQLARHAYKGFVSQLPLAYPSAKNGIL